MHDHLRTEKLASTERHLDVAKGHSQRADDKTDELKQLNRSIFRPVITFNKDAKRAAQEAKVQQRYDEDREEREKAMMDIRHTQDRLGRAQTYGQRDDVGARQPGEVAITEMFDRHAAPQLGVGRPRAQHEQPPAQAAHRLDHRDAEELVHRRARHDR